MAQLIEATLVLRNWFIDFKSRTVAVPSRSQYKAWMHIGGDLVYENECNQVDGADAERARNIVKEYLYENI